MSTTATVTKTATGALPPAPGGGKRIKSPLAIGSVSKAKDVVDDLLAGMTNHLDHLGLTAAIEKDAKQRAERELDVERSKLAVHERKDKTPKPAGAGRGKSARDQQVLDELAQLGIGIDGAESNLKKSKEQLVGELNGMRARAEAAEATGKALKGELSTMKADAEAAQVRRKKLEEELASARGEVGKLTAQIKEEYEKHVKSENEHLRKEEELEDELAGKEELLERVIGALRKYRARVEAYGHT
jgi:chromosome segregation ATPase